MGAKRKVSRAIWCGILLLWIGGAAAGGLLFSAVRKVTKSTAKTKVLDSFARPARFRSLGCDPHVCKILQGALNVVSSLLLRRCR